MNIKILRLRYSLKLSQSDMALALGISRSTLVRIERGDISPKADIIKKLSILSGKNISYFYHTKDRHIEKIQNILIEKNVSNDILSLLIKQIEEELISDSL
ncbi:helix-turn-helix domain-containing protein [Photobacterium piscicola]|uniref:Helix-turn-helix transcriptional regulator n=2 Tax=Photobacterium piscicola TaxID=1378299 RepID=A0ABU6LC77_9GAMM|nr:helix-turn-helix transcriptional regulator [Photobacterium piscicola]MEC6881310.1 helix-turn-helix transcriptional regulator [Photobacterium piscicola]MEC6897171.1 helix-turn-helix transcriptional regulator [Photobacterium piscicola]